MLLVIGWLAYSQERGESISRNGQHAMLTKIGGPLAKSSIKEERFSSVDSNHSATKTHALFRIRARICRSASCMPIRLSSPFVGLVA
jgi:hypothetical protein